MASPTAASEASVAQVPFTLRGIEHVLVLVNGMEQALQFYQGVLGAEVESRLTRYAMAELRVGESHIDLVDIEAPEGAWARPSIAGGRNVDHIGLRIEGCDATAVRNHLAARGVAIVEERTSDGPAGSTLSLYVRDPSGNVIEIMGEFNETPRASRSRSRTPDSIASEW